MSEKKLLTLAGIATKGVMSDGFTMAVFDVNAVPVGTKVFAINLDAPREENLALRMFLLYYSGNPGCSVKGMRDQLTYSGFHGHWPKWAEEGTHYLTKEAAQDWIIHLLFRDVLL